MKLTEILGMLIIAAVVLMGVLVFAVIFMFVQYGEWQRYVVLLLIFIAVVTVCLAGYRRSLRRAERREESLF